MDSSEKFSVTINGEMIINSKGDITDNMQSTEESVEVYITGSATTSNNSLLNVDTLSQIAAIVTIITLLIVIWEKAGKEKRIVYTRKNINTHSNMSCTRFTFWNTSKEILSGSDFSEKNYIAINPANENTTIETINIVAEYKKGYCNLEKTVSNPNECRFKFDKIGYRQGFVVDVVHNGKGKKDLIVSGSTLEYDVENILYYITVCRIFIICVKFVAAIISSLFTILLAMAIENHIRQVILGTHLSIGFLIIGPLIMLLFAILSLLLIQGICEHMEPDCELRKACKAYTAK